MSAKISKKATCFLLVLTLILSSLGSTALASTVSKTATYEYTYNFLINPSDFPKYMSSPSSYVPQTYNYNDGTYNGTLYLVSAACHAPLGMSGQYLKVEIHAKYSGTVKAPSPSKSVTKKVDYTFQIRPEQFPDYMSSPSSYVPSVYYYNDGTYSGYIYLKSAACSVPTSKNGYLHVTIFTEYSGTAIRK